MPVRANGVEMPLLELIESLETIAGAHGVGRIDVVENRLAGIKSREIYEAPAAVVLHTAHKELEKLVIPRELERVKHDSSRIYADLVYSGLWFSHTRQTIDAFVARCSRASPARSASSCSRATAASSAGKSPLLRPMPPDADRCRPPRSAGRLMAHLWSGRFEGSPDAALFEFGASFRFDRRLFEDDVTGSLAWAEAIGAPASCRSRKPSAIRHALEEILRSRARSGVLRLRRPRKDDEDVHSFVERELVQRVGDAGRRLHTGRSRNEQVALDLRLYLKRRVPLLQRKIAALVDGAGGAGRGAPATR